MKYCKDLTIAAVEYPNDGYVLLKLTDIDILPDIKAGQFVEIKVDDSVATFLRRPISVNYVDRRTNQLWLLIQIVGEGTRHLSQLKQNEMVNVIFPLGNGFTYGCKDEVVLLIGGGVGIAPLLEYGKQLKEVGAIPLFLLGGRSACNLLQLNKFSKLGHVYITTEDASMGEKGFVTQHSMLDKVNFNRISCCGPKPMMMSVARWAKQHNVPCEVSLENMMACGLGACLCCVEKTVKGNVCVCNEGPVFNVEQLTW